MKANSIRAFSSHSIDPLYYQVVQTQMQLLCSRSGTAARSVEDGKHAAGSHLSQPLDIIQALRAKRQAGTSKVFVRVQADGRRFDRGSIRTVNCSSGSEASCREEQAAGALTPFRLQSERGAGGASLNLA